MFAYILELLQEGGREAFFELKKGGRKANNAQKEKRRLAWKRSCASKREREREAAKAAKLPTRQQQCEACGRKFESRKTAKKHKCPNSKVVRVREEAASGQASQATPAAKLDKPPATPTPPAPTTPSYITSLPAVTGDSQDNSLLMPIQHIETGQQLRIRKEEVPRYRDTGLWKPGWT
ncbi:hypothetical protein BGW80DRAFT_1387278 [Lactifluus volemus]|nr:hypothetical protein BGW80DRAFT_1387278 [Lactifluus volemus]